MDLQQIIQQNHLELLFQQGTFGLEKESQRVSPDASIVITSHPKAFGNRSFHPYIQTDFAESQLELITPPTKTLEEALAWLSAIHDVVLRSLPDNEFLLPFSMPVVLPHEDKIKVAQLDNPEDVAYREYLVKTYGKNKQMVSGIHYNFQLSPEFIDAIFNLQTEYQDKLAFQNDLYLKLARNFLRYQWILVYLLAASPTVDPKYFKGGSPLKSHQYVRSLRSGKYGYVNHADVKVSYESLEQYVESLEECVKSGKLIAEKEFYSNVRLRGAKTAREFLQTGIKYLEFRLFDLNPLEPCGICLEDARFIHHFILFMLWIDQDCTQEDVEDGIERLMLVASEHPYSRTMYQEEGELLLAALIDMLNELGASDEAIAVVEDKLNQMAEPELTLSGQIAQSIELAGSYRVLASRFGQLFKKEALEHVYALSGFEDMELSTQALIFDAIQKGLSVELLDRNDQFLKLQFGEHFEYVKNGNMTSHDSYIAPLIMENKVVTKKVLAKAGFNVPSSLEFTSVEQAIASYPLFVGKAVVIKPKSTNYGLGISIFQQGVQDLADFSTAVEIAFREDKEIMIEDYLVGTEYRFFVLGDQTLAVLQRVPANVVGDGKRTIAELVAIKNNSPLRGDGSRTPLKRIALGEIELLQLKEQGFAIDSTPARKQVVQLRANSNISTGGDSIDMTDAMHPSYKQLAVGIAQAMGAKVCGVDLIIPDLTKPAGPELSSWGVIEANFNPMMMMHIFPAQGKSRRLTLEVIKMLFPELPIN